MAAKVMIIINNEQCNGNNEGNEICENNENEVIMIMVMKENET